MLLTTTITIIQMQLHTHNHPSYVTTADNVHGINECVCECITKITTNVAAAQWDK